MPWVEIDKAAAPATTITLGATWNPFAGDPISATVGQTVFLAVTALNGGLNTPTYALSVPPGETATWQRITQSRGNPSSGSTGRGDVFAIMPTQDWVNFNVQITFTSVPASADPPGWADWLVMEGGTLVPRSLNTFYPYLNGGAGESGASHTLNGTGQPRTADLCIGFTTNSVAGSIPGLDADSTNGAWVSVGAADTGGAKALQGRLQYKIVTGRGDQTLDPANAENTVMACLVAQEDYSFVQSGGNIDGGTADPLWIFTTATVPMTANDFIYGTTCSKRWDSIVNTPGTYTPDESKTSGTVNSGGGNSGSVKGASFHKTADGTEGANLVVALTSAGGATIGVGSIVRGKSRWAAAAAVWLTDTTIGADTDVSGTTLNVTADGTINVQPGDRILWSVMSKHSTAPTSATPAFTGVTGVSYQTHSIGAITDPDVSIVSGYFEVDTGSGATTPSLTATTPSGFSDGVATFTRVRLVIIPLAPIITGCDNNGTEDELTLDWVNGGFVPTHYEVRIDGGGWTNIGNVLTHTFTGLTPGSTHTLDVRACNDGGCSTLDSTSCTTLSGVPSNLVVTTTQTTAEFCWDAASGSPDEYEVRIDGGPETSVGTDLCSGDFTGLDPNTAYLFEVRACLTGVGCTDWVSIIGITNPPDPVNLTATPDPTTIEFCWAAGTPDGSELPVTYEVRIDGSGDATGIEDVCHTFGGLAQTTTYLLEVRACTSEGCSEWVTLEAATTQGQAWSPCPCGAKWGVETADLATGRVRGILLPVAIDMQTIGNTISTGTLTFPIKGVRLRDIWPGLTSIYLTYDGEPVGAFLTAKPRAAGGTVQVGIESIESYLRRRMIRTDLTYTGIQQTAIAASLVAQGVPDGIPLTGQALPSVIPRDRSYLGADRPFIWPTLEALMQSENGPDYTLLHTKTAGHWSTRMLFEDEAGRDSQLTLLGDVHLTDYSIDVDAIDLTNLADGIGAGGLIATSDQTASSPYPRFDAAPQFTEVTSLTTLQEQTDGYVDIRSQPYAVPGATIVGDWPAPADLGLHDTAIFRFSNGVATFDGPAKVTGITWRASEGEPLMRALTLEPVGSVIDTVLNQAPTEICRDC